MCGWQWQAGLLNYWAFACVLPADLPDWQMQASIAVIEQNFGSTPIHISAQKYLTKFYSSLGFKKVGEEYLEDGIPHLAMIKE